MFTVINPNLPDVLPERVSQGAYAGQVIDNAGVGGAIAATIAVSPRPVSETLESALQVEVDTWLIDAGSTSFSDVDAIAQNGNIWRRAQSVGDLQPGEFIYDPLQKVITLKSGSSHPFIGGLAIQLLGSTPTIIIDEITDPPLLLEQLPLISAQQGEALSWSLSPEGFPRGQLSLQASSQSIGPLLQALRPGTALNLFGIGFRVADGVNRNDGDPIANPSGRFAVTVPLESRWQSQASKPIAVKPLFSGGFSGTGQQSEPFSDPDCALPTNKTAGGSSGGGSIDLALASGIVWQGPTIVYEVGSDASPGDTVTFKAEVERRARVWGGTIDWSGSDAVRFVPIDGVNNWHMGVNSIPRQDIDTTFNGFDSPNFKEFEFAPEIIPAAIDVSGAFPEGVAEPAIPALIDEPAITSLAANYRNVRLSGAFTESPDEDDEAEDTQGPGRLDPPPTWRERQPVIENLREGDKNPTSPPVGATRLQNLSVLGWKSGPTKTLSIVRKEDGVVVREEVLIYGYAFLGRDIVDSDGALNGSPGTRWQVIEHRIKTYNFDAETGYYLGFDESGWRLGQFQEEGEESPESIGLDPSNPDDAKEFALYKIRRIPLRASERVLLRLYRADYEDVEGESPYLLVKTCLPDGTAAYQYIQDPSFVPPMYAKQIASESSSLAYMHNPDSTVDEPLPKLIVGSEGASVRKIEIAPSGSTRGLDFTVDESTPDRYTEWISEASADGAGFANFAASERFSDKTGRPGLAQRKPSLLERQEQSEPPESPTGNDSGRQDSQTEYMHLLNTSGSSPNDAPGGSISFEIAQTLEQALIAAKTDLYLEQLASGDRESLQLFFNPEIRCYDRLTYIRHSEFRKRRILEVQHGVAVYPQPRSIIQGKIVHRSKYQGKTTVTVARDVDPRGAISLTSIALPKPPTPPDRERQRPPTPLFQPPSPNAEVELGELLQPGLATRTRGNY